MKLLASLTSPFVRKIRVLLIERQIAFEFVHDSPSNPGSLVPGYNPLGKIPTLVTDSGEAFFDSPVIADYLETLTDVAPRLPADPLEAVRVRQLEALADGVADAAVIWLLETRRAAEKQDPGVIAHQRSKIERGLNVLERHLTEAEWLHDSGFSRADIAAGCCVLWLDFRLPQFDWRSTRPALASYAERLAARPSFAETIPVA